MKELVIATNNKHKCQEMQYLLEPFGIKLISLADLNINIDVEENGNTYAENALIKAKAIYDIVKKPVLADDSGIEIEALNNQPGIHSARFMDEYNYYQKCEALLELTKDNPNKKAQFVCVLALVINEKENYTFEGIVKGHISNYISSSGGFGYDIFFIPNNSNTLFSEMNLGEKNSYSHRSKATINLLHFLFNNETIFNKL